MTTRTQRIEAFETSVNQELLEDILPFWPRYRDEGRGGFFGLVKMDGSYEAEADKGLVMHARFLWTYSAALERNPRQEWQSMATHAYRYLVDSLYDTENGGFFWLVKANGKPLPIHKVIYGQAFAIYALARYFRATGDETALDLALSTFGLLESHARDLKQGGYFEACAPDWSKVIPGALDKETKPCPKSMNTNLHVLEAYSELYKASGSLRVKEALERLLEVHVTKILGDNGHFNLFFDESWKPLSKIKSFGHDIEGSWLLCEASAALNGGIVSNKVREASLKQSSKILAIVQKHKCVINEEKEGHLDTDRHWWPQAEGVVGFLNAFQLSGDEAYFEAAESCWKYIEDYLVDRKNGEWFWGRREDGSLMSRSEKGGAWKACYHNGRACMEAAERLEKISIDSIPGPIEYRERRAAVEKAYKATINAANRPVEPGNGIFKRYEKPVLTAAHVPPRWRFDYDPVRNPHFMERLGIDAVFNSGALKFSGEYYLVPRVEGWDRKSFFAVAKSKDGVSAFEFIGEPIALPETSDPDVNVYDMRLTAHEDGWIYGIFCSERKDKSAPAGDMSMATASAGIVRTRDFISWKRLPDLVTKSPQQRNVVLHPEFYKGKYLLYTRPQDGFIEAGSGGGICWGLADTMEGAEIMEEKLLDPRAYHTIKESKNGAGATPIKTPKGWLHIAHGVRNTAAGLRYVIYAFMTDLAEPGKVIARPGGYLIAPKEAERVGDVSNVCFCNGAIADEDGRLLIYYASSDTRLHLAESSVDRMVDYCLNTPEDGLRTGLSVDSRIALIKGNRDIA